MGQCCGKKTAPVEGDDGPVEVSAEGNPAGTTGYATPQGDAAEGAGP